ncbi:MAG: hypothetical protein JXA94_00530 [Parachlamydiales bacterium]|nr:hypothetical protein [Parachlamydiales bacterium]
MIDPLSLYLSKLIGLAFIIIGIALFAKPHDFQNTVKDVAKSNAIMTLISVCPLVVGLAIVIGHNIWVSHWIVLITIIGWLILVCGVIRLFFHKEIMEKMAKIATKKHYFVWVGIALFLVGCYLAGKGFFAEKFLS